MEANTRTEELESLESDFENVFEERLRKVKASRSAKSAKLKLEGQQAELLARAAMLTQKQALEKEKANLKAKREQLELETEIAANAAKLNIIEFEQLHVAPLPSGDRMNDYFEN